MAGSETDLLKMLGITPALAERFAERFTSDPDTAQEWLNGVMREAMSEGSTALAEQLKRDAPSMLKHRRAEKASFERRLQETWKKAFDLYDIVLTACWEAGADLNARYRPDAAARQDFVFEALTLVHGQACLIASEVRALLASGHPTGAHARWRALHELAVVGFLLPDGGDGIAERFLLHQHVESLKDAEVYQTYCQRLGQTPFTNDQMHTMRERVDELKTRYGAVFTTDWGWAAPLIPQLKGATRFSDLENVASLNHLRPYYRWATKAVHVGSKAVANSRIRRGPEIHLLTGPTNYGLADPGQSALISLGQVTTMYVLYGWRQLQDPKYLLMPSAFKELVDEAAHTFVHIQHDLEARERKLWENDPPTTRQPDAGGSGTEVN